MKRIGIVGIDRSGSKGNYPLVIVSVYSDKMKNFEKTVKEIQNSLKIHHDKIKGKDFDKSMHEKIIEIVIANNIQFIVYLVEGKLYEQIKHLISSYHKKWEHILEAVLWYKACSLLIKRTRILPNEVFYEKTYEEEVFDSIFKELLYEKFGLENIETGYKFSPYIIVADCLANFFHKNSKLWNKYGTQTIKCRIGLIDKILWKYIKKKEQVQSTHGWRNNRLTHADQTINRIVKDIFKAFGHFNFSLSQVNYTDDSSGKTTYMFSNTTENKHGLLSMQKPWIVLMNYQANDQPLFITTSRKTLSSIPLKVTADENEAITKLTFNQSFTTATNL